MKVKNFGELIVHKPNQLIEIEGGYLTTSNLLAYNYILHKLQKQGVNNTIISGADFFRDLEFSKHYEELIEYLDSLRKISVVSRDSKGKLWGSFNLLSAFKRLENGTFYVEIPNLIFNSLCTKDNLYYTTIKLLEQKAFKCTYSIVFYEIFKKYEKINIPIFTLDELKRFTDTQDKYKEYKYFKRDVIEKALREINLFDNEFEYIYEEEKLGRKVDKIKFKRIDKFGVVKTKKTTIFSKKLETTIEKARKNQYINSVYSKKTIENLLNRYDEIDIIKALNESYKYNSEIFNFSRFLTAKITDIINSKPVLTQEKIISNVYEINEIKEEIFLQPMDISKADYEQLYESYLKENKIPPVKSVRIGFDRMNLKKFNIID